MDEYDAIQYLLGMYPGLPEFEISSILSSARSQGVYRLGKGLRVLYFDDDGVYFMEVR